jgi:hypothetical protein
VYAIYHPVKFLLVYKDLVGLLIQLGLLFATVGLIRVGSRQAKAAHAQATAANQQVIAALQQVKAANAQAKAAEAQVEVALQQVDLAKAQLENATSQLREQVHQGSTSSRPHFEFRDGDPHFSTSPVVIRNVGPGVAYRVTWRFVKPRNADLTAAVYEVGTLAVDQERAVPWPFDKDNPRLKMSMMDEHGIRVEYMDDAGRMYYTIAKVEGPNDGFAIDSGPIGPQS